MKKEMDRFAQHDVYQYFSHSALVPMTLRVAVAGHRTHSNISVDNSSLIQQISAVYKLIYSQLNECHTHPYAKRLYAQQAPTLRIVSSLADGADRLLAESELVGEEFELSCILPFHADEYANDFDAKSRDEFYQLLRRAGYQTERNRVLELDGTRDNADHAYRDCGESLVKNCDLLVALYDGAERDGYGTSYTVSQALKNKIPVIWIDTDHPNAVYFWQWSKSQLTKEPFNAQQLSSWLGHLLLFDTILDQPDIDGSAPLAEKVLHKFDNFSSENLTYTDSDELIDFNDQGPIVAQQSRLNPLTHGFSTLKKLLTSTKAVNRDLAKFQDNVSSEADLANSVEHLCQHFHSPTSHSYYAAYLRADRLASMYSALHRSIFVFIYMLGAGALIIAALAIAVADKQVYGKLPLVCAIIELAILILIFTLYKRDHSRKYHDKWLEYRCIAEFLRPTLFLSFFGTNYPMRRFRDSEETIGRNLLGHGGAERCWAYLYTETVLRWVGFSGHKVDREYINRAIDFTRGQWLSQQYQYHTKNAIAMKLLGKRLAKISEVMFFATIVAVTMKISMGLAGVSIFLVSKGLGLLATWLPVLGTTAFAIRNHAEFEISAQRSLSTREVLLGFNKRLQDLQAIDASMSKIDDLLTELTSETISETADWLEIYEVKESETA